MTAELPKISEAAIAAWGAAKARLSGARLIDLWTRAQTLLYFEEQLAMAAKQASNPSIFTRYAGPMAQVFGRTKDAAKEGAKDLPAGRYTTRLKSLKLKEYDAYVDGKKSGNKTLGALGQFTVVLGDATGQSAPWFPKDFHDEERFLYFLRDCVRMGLDVDSIDMTNSATAMKNLDAALQELAKRRPAVEIEREEWESNGRTGVNTKIKNVVSEDQIEAMGGVRVDQAGGDNGGDPAEMSDETVLPPDEDETPAPVARTPKAAAGNGKAPAKPAAKAATPAPTPTAATRPPRQAAAPKRQEQPVDLDVGGDEEIEDVTDDGEGEIEDLTEAVIDVGSRVQLNVRGTVKTGIIKREDADDASKWIIKDEASSSMWRIPKEEPSLVLAD